MATDNVIRSHLLRLPQEIILRIAGFSTTAFSPHLTIADLGNLRRTCKQIEQQLFEAFAREFFKKKSFLVEEPSIQVLLDISKHPSLRLHCQDVLFDARVTRPVDDSGVHNIDTLNVRLLGAQFRQTGIARDMIVEALKGLPNLRTISYRDFDSLDKDRRFRQGFECYWRPRGYSISNGSLMSDPSGHKLLMILVACALAGCSPERLEVFLRHRPKLSPASLILPERCADIGLGKVLQGLKVLMLAVTFTSDTASHSYYPHFSRHLHARPQESPLRSFLLQTPALEVLRLNFEPFEHHTTSFVNWLASSPDSDTATPSPVMPSLHTLDLGKATLSLSSLLAVLMKFDLKAISLWEITLESDVGASQDPDRWSAFLNSLSTKLSHHSRLESIMIGRARQSAIQEHLEGRSENVSFVPVGTDHDKKAEAVRDAVVRFSAKHSSQTVQAWLLQLSSLTYVASLHDHSQSGSDSDGSTSNTGSSNDSDSDNSDDSDDG